MEFDLAYWAAVAENVAKIGAFLLGAWTIVWAAAKFVFSPVKRGWDRLGREYLNIKNDLAHVKKELTPNGGSSLNDAIKSIKQSVFLIESRQKARSRFDTLCQFEVSGDGDISWANRALLRLVGITEGEILGKAWYNLIYFEDKEEVIETWNDCIKNKIDFKHEYRLFCSDGRVKKVYVEAAALKDSQGNLLGMVGTVTELH